MPRSTSADSRVATPSASNALDAWPRGRKVARRYNEPPLTADTRCPSSERATSGANSTAHSRVESLRAPSRATARPAALPPIEANAGKAFASRTDSYQPSRCIAALHAGTFRIRDCSVTAARGLDLAADVDRAIDIQLPRMPQVQVGKRRLHQRRIDQPCAGIVFGVARDRARLRDRRVDGCGFQVGGGSAALALPEKHREPETTV